MITYEIARSLDIERIIEVFESLGIVRPTGDKECIESMFKNSNLIYFAYDNGELVGLARCVTDFSYCCYLSDLAVKNPRKITGRIGKQKSDEEVAFWTKEEYLQFIEAVKDKDISFYAFELLYWTGIHLGELRALTKGDFNFEKKTMRISKSAQRINGEEVITDLKTPKSNRTIIPPDFLIKEV